MNIENKKLTPLVTPIERVATNNDIGSSDSHPNNPGYKATASEKIPTNTTGEILDISPEAATFASTHPPIEPNVSPTYSKEGEVVASGQRQRSHPFPRSKAAIEAARRALNDAEPPSSVEEIESNILATKDMTTERFEAMMRNAPDRSL